MSSRTIVVEAEPRESLGKGPARRLRRAGRVPAVVYGLAKVPRTLSLDTTVWANMEKKSTAHIVEIKVAGGVVINALVKEVKHDMFTGVPKHIDFQEIDLTHVIKSVVTLYCSGTAAGVSKGGISEQLIHHIDIVCLPQDIPESVHMDVSGVELNGFIKIGDIKLPEGVKAASDHDAVAFHVVEFKEKAAVEGEAAEGEAAPAAAEPAKGKEPAKKEAAPAKKEPAKGKK